MRARIEEMDDGPRVLFGAGMSTWISRGLPVLDAGNTLMRSFDFSRDNARGRCKTGLLGILSIELDLLWCFGLQQAMSGKK
jgi:hypothetical protein